LHLKAPAGLGCWLGAQFLLGATVPAGKIGWLAGAIVRTAGVLLEAASCTFVAGGGQPNGWTTGLISPASPAISIPSVRLA